MADANEPTYPRGWAKCIDETCPIQPPRPYGAAPHAHPSRDPRTKQPDATREALREAAMLLEDFAPDRSGRWLANVLRDVARSVAAPIHTEATHGN